jgi:hypothetical protein
MATTKKPMYTLGLISVFTFILSIVPAQAEQPIDCMTCGNTTMTTIVESEDLTIIGFESKGINLDNTEGKIFDNMTSHSVGLVKIEKGKSSANFYTKYLDPNGDVFVVEGSQVGMERDWKFIYGTGKFKGITGAGKAVVFTKGKPVSPGTSQSCTKITGTYELKK